MEVNVILAKVLVLIFVIWNAGMAISESRKGYKAGKKSLKDFVTQVCLSFVTSGLFIYAFFISKTTFIPAFFIWTTVVGFWSLFWFATVACTIFEVFYLYIFRKRILGEMSSSDRRDLALSNDKFYMSFISILPTSISAGLIEEYLFRFLFFLTLQPVVSFILGFVNISAAVSLIPQWLFLGAGVGVMPAVFLTALILNFFFALAHKRHGDKDNLWHRVIMAWFMGWILFIALVNFGLLGAMLLHILVDIVELTIMTYLVTKLVEHEYMRLR